MDKLSVLVWNVRGLNDRGRRDMLRKVVDDFRPSVVCIQETKLSYISERDVISFLGQDFSQFVYLPAQQTRGGILIAWRDGSFSVERLSRSSSAATMKLPGGSLECMVPNVMLIKFPSLRNYEMSEQAARDLGC